MGGLELPPWAVGPLHRKLEPGEEVASCVVAKDTAAAKVLLGVTTRRAFVVVKRLFGTEAFFLDLPGAAPRASRSASRDPGTPYVHGAFTLYARPLTGGGPPVYFFSRNRPKTGAPAPLPEGHVVVEDAHTGVPRIKKAPDERREATRAPRTPRPKRKAAVRKRS